MLIQNKKSKLNIKLQYIGLFIIGLILFYLPNTASAAWMDAKWLYRAAVPITAHTAAETNVYTTITIDTATPIAAGKMQADCGDIRVAKFNGATLPYFINASPGCNNVATTIQVYFTSFPAGAQTIYYYYGNPTTYNGFKNSGFATAATGETIGTVGSEEQSANPVGYWKFDDGQGQSTKDGSSQGNNGTLGATSGSSTDDPTWITEDQCVSGKCLKFDGVGTYVNVGDPTNGSLDFGTSSFSISAWVRTGSSSNQTIVSKRNSATGSTGYRFRISSTGALLLTVTDESANQVDPNTSGYNLIDNKWHYVEVVANRTTNIATFYVDGKPVVASASDLSSVTGSISNNIGLRVGFTPDSAQPFDGFLDNVKIYNYARTAAQIRADYNAGKNNATAHSGSSAVMGAKTQDYLSSGLVGYWKMDETSGDAADSSGNSNTGTWAGTGSHYPAGKFGNGGGFNGTDDYVTKATTNISTAPLTVSAWFKTSDVTQSGKMIVNLFGGNYYLDVNSGTARFVQNGIGAVSGSISNNTWYHLVGTIDSSNQMTLYINGVNAGSRSSNGPTGGGTRVTIGAHNGGSSDFLNGTVDEVRVYNRALSPTEISSLYNWAPGPVGYWDFEEKTSTSTYDTSGNGNTGALGGGATAKVPIWATGKIGSALNFDGINDLVEVTNESNFDFTNSFTVEAWIQPTGSDTYNGIVGKYVGTATGWDFILTNGKSRMAVRGTDSIDNTGVGSDLRDGKWHHVVAVINGTSSITTYTDGKFVDTTTGTWTAVTNDEPVKIGGRYSAPDLPFRGKIDQVRVFNYARTSKQIVEDMNAGHPAVGTPVGSAIGHWKFDEGQGITANNAGSGGSTLNGSISGASWSHSGKFGRALSFDGNNDDINAGSNAAVDNLMNNDATFSTWINPDVCNGIRDVLGKNGGAARGWYFLASTSNCDPKLIVYYDSGVNSAAYQASTGSVATGTWQQLTAVWTANTKSAKLYVNGKEVSYATQTAGTGTYDADASYNLAIGNYSPGAADTRLFDGLLDDVKIYPYALTADEVKTDFNKGQALQMSAAGNNTTYAAGAANQEYCVPGDTTSCAAPVARWDFEEGSGTSANDASGNANTGTWAGTGATHWASGKVGKAAKFNGTDDYIYKNDSNFNADGNWTIEAWVKINGDGQVFSAGDNSGTTNPAMRLDAYATGIGAWRRDDSNTELGSGVSGAITYGQWTHIAYAYNGSAVALYINGVNVGNPAWTTGTLSTEDIAIGILRRGRTVTGGLSGIFNGQVDNMRIFDYVRTTAQIVYDYNRGAPVGWWKMDECQGGTIYDSSGKGNNGTITIGALGEDTLGVCSTASTAWGSGATGKRNSSLDFDGTDDYAVVGTGLINKLNTTGITFAAWINADSGVDQRIMSSSEAGNFLFGISGTSFNLYLKTTDHGWRGLNSNGLVSIGSWQHIVWTYDGASTTNFYLNGKINTIDTITHSGALATFTSDSTYIGTRNSLANAYFNGKIDDLRVYNYTLNATQVKDLYTNGSASFAPVTGAP